jgi:hypothetical protein
MSSTTTTSANFQSILDAALHSYAKQTGIDLIKHPSADKLQNCRSPDDVLQILLERESVFKDHRDQYRNLFDSLRPVVHVVHAVSSILGKVAGLVSAGIVSSLSDHVFTHPYRCHSNQQKLYLSALMFSSQYISSFSFSPGPYMHICVRLLLASVHPMMRLLTSLNASQISLDASIFIPRRFRCPLQ